MTTTLITGANKSLGYETARRLIEAGHTVYVAARDPERGKAAAARLGGLRRVVLGHGDTDHRGSAPALSEIAPILCHQDAVGEAEGSGGRSYWRRDQLPPSNPCRSSHRAASQSGCDCVVPR